MVGIGLLGTSIEAVEHGVIFEEDAEKIESIILHSDGFNYEILDLSLEQVVEQCTDQKSINSLQRQIREAEENDKYANGFVRFKTSDDMSVIIYR